MPSQSKGGCSNASDDGNYRQVSTLIKKIRQFNINNGKGLEDDEKSAEYGEKDVPGITIAMLNRVKTNSQRVRTSTLKLKIVMTAIVIQLKS